MKREIIRIEPLSTWRERCKAPTSAVTRHADTLYVSGLPRFDPQSSINMPAWPGHFDIEIDCIAAL